MIKGLSEKEKLIVELLNKGIDNKEIERILNMSHNTFKVYTYSILNKSKLKTCPKLD